MKIKNLLFAALTMFAFAACTDIPDSPYDFPGTGGNDEPEVEGENLLENSDFEIWESSAPAAWGQTVTNSTYSQSTDAHSGSSAVLIEGYSSSNKRFASKSYTLKPGNYTLSTYIKKSGETLGQYRLGYAKLTNGVVADTQNDYVYITSATAVPTEWKKVSCNFTLEAETEIAINIMNSKYGEGAAILIDDVALTTTDGGLADGTEGGEEKPETQATTFLKETFATSLGSFTTQQIVGDFPWKFEEYNGKGYAKVSGFANGASQDAESWLISPEFNLSNATKAFIAFDYVINKGDASAAATNHLVVITDNYTGDVATTEWTAIPFGAVNDNTWNFKSVSNVKVPESMIGKSKVVIAFKYLSSTANSSTWEMNNLVISGDGEATDIPDTPDNPEVGGDLFKESFSTSLGAFTTQQTVDNFEWKFEEYNGKGYAKVSGFANGASQEAESWLISPTINFTGVNTAYISFDYVINKGDASLAATNHRVAITDNYTGDVATTEWTYVNFGAYNDNTWSFKSTGKIALPEAMMNKTNIVIAFKYNSTSANSSTWEMNNLVVAYGEGSTPETPDTPNTPDNPGEEPEDPDTPETPEIPAGDNILENGSFEEWNGSTPAGWGKDGSNASAHSATVEQSTEAHEGNYAVIVNGDAKSNKRLASKSYKLPAGTYTYTVYVKTNGSEAGHCRIGYVPITDGKAGSYVYEEAAASAVTGNWTAKTLEFTLTEETTISLVVMNNKTGNGASFLVDDATLVKK